MPANERAVDSKEDQRIQQILMQRIAKGRRAEAGTAFIRFSVSEAGEPSLEAPEGVSQAEAEGALLRGLLRHFLET